MPIFRRRKNCIHTASGICVLGRRLQRAKIPDAVRIQIFPPEDGHVNARNMSRIIV